MLLLSSAATAASLVALHPHHTALLLLPVCQTVGAFTVDIAGNAKPGQVLRLDTTTSPGDTSSAARFRAGVIISVEVVNATGRYQPAIEHPFLSVDGVIMPL